MRNAVIEFPSARTGRSTGRKPGLHAEIIIFPGVRIERPEVIAAERQCPAARGSAIVLMKDAERL